MAQLKSLSINGTNIDNYIDGRIPSVATDETDGLMSKEDFSKLNGITAGANKVEASADYTSGTKIGSITINDGTAIEFKVPVQNNASQDANGLMSKDDFTKLNGITAGANKVEASSESLTGTKIGSITINDDTPIVFNAPAPIEYSEATAEASGLMSKEDFSKLDGIAEGATKDVLFSESKNLEGEEIGSVTINGTTTTFNAPKPVTYSEATSDASGLMSSTDKAKLDGFSITISSEDPPETLAENQIYIQYEDDTPTAEEPSTQSDDEPIIE